MTTSLKAYVVSQDFDGSQIVYLIESFGEEERYSLSLRDDGSIVREKLNEGGVLLPDQPKPFLRVRGSYGRELLAALVEGLAKSGIERPSESKLAGLYEAQSAHLADLRSFLRQEGKLP